MSSTPRRITDWAFFAYFVFQIPSTLIFDSQGVYPSYLYPGWAKALRSHYLNHYKDAFLENAWNYPWYLSFCLVEHWIEFPFFIWVVWAHYQGRQAHARVQLATLMYSLHTVTVVLAVWAAAMFIQFNTTSPTANEVTPTSVPERLKLCSAYAPFMVFSSWMVVDSYRQLMRLLCVKKD